ncbi:acetyltransferase [Knoellia sp. p5-6-4]|uniref:acetyltransferase n=1 Tax=unclassified Knoellia TaxID=2618719 RepID=UPI0023DC3F7B|nr:acetyltransferase [Knoellia sp. p5-6-4]MDF2146607.1 acetyltransferase [Knoellia sp. p5-6-4]
MTHRDKAPRVLHVFGAGGQGREAAWFARARWGEDLEVRFVVDDPRFVPADRADVGLVRDIRPTAGHRWVAAVGDVAARRRATEALGATGMPATRVVHPGVDLSGVEHLGADVIVGAGAVLSVGVSVHDHVHVNVGATVSHDVVLGEYATLSPGVHVAGWVDIRPGAVLGIGATVVNGSPGRRLVIGEGAVVAAGACVLGDVEPGTMYAGVPARRKR